MNKHIQYLVESIFDDEEFIDDDEDKIQDTINNNSDKLMNNLLIAEAPIMLREFISQNYKENNMYFGYSNKLTKGAISKIDTLIDINSMSMTILNKNKPAADIQIRGDETLILKFLKLLNDLGIKKLTNKFYISLENKSGINDINNYFGQIKFEYISISGFLPSNIRIINANTISLSNFDTLKGIQCIKCSELYLDDDFSHINDLNNIYAETLDLSFNHYNSVNALKNTFKLPKGITNFILTIEEDWLDGRHVKNPNTFTRSNSNNFSGIKPTFILNDDLYNMTLNLHDENTIHPEFLNLNYDKFTHLNIIVNMSTSTLTKLFDNYYIKLANKKYKYTSKNSRTPAKYLELKQFIKLPD